MYYSNKRRQYLVDQGYAYKVINNFNFEYLREHSRFLNTVEAQLDLLEQVMNANADRDQDEEERVRGCCVVLIALEGCGCHERCAPMGACSKPCSRERGTVAVALAGVIVCVQMVAALVDDTIAEETAAAQRRRGNIAALSGAKGISYMEANRSGM